MVQKNRSERRWIIDILLLNLIFRAVWLVIIRPPQKADFLWYFQHAKMLAAGQGYHWMGHATAYWPIGWPFFLSLIYRITGPSIIVGLAVNVILSTLIVYLVYKLTRSLFHRRDIAFTAAIVYSLLPSQIEWNAILGSEELFTCLLLISLFLYMYRTQENTHRPMLWLIASGIILGLSADVRPIPLLFPVFAFLYEWWVRQALWKQSIKTAIILGCSMFLAIIPVTIRNAVAMHHFVLVSTNGGVNLWQGTHTNGGYYWSWNPKINPLLHINNEIQKNSIAEKAAIQHIVHHIPTTIENGFLKIFDLYKADVNSTWYTFHMIPALKNWTAPVDAVNTSYYFLFMMAFVIGLAVVFATRRTGWKNAMFLMAFIIYNTCFFFFFPAWDRFRYPLMPMFAVFAGVGIIAAWRTMRNKTTILPPK